MNVPELAHPDQLDCLDTELGDGLSYVLVAGKFSSCKKSTDQFE